MKMSIRHFDKVNFFKNSLPALTLKFHHHEFLFYYFYKFFQVLSSLNSVQAFIKKFI